MQNQGVGQNRASKEHDGGGVWGGGDPAVILFPFCVDPISIFTHLHVPFLSEDSSSADLILIDCLKEFKFPFAFEDS